MAYMTPEEKLRTLAEADISLQVFFGTAPFRWFDVQLPQGQISSGCCALVKRVSTVRVYSQAGLQDLSQIRFQIDVLAPNTVNKQMDPQTARLAAKAIIDFIGTVDLASLNQFNDPATTPNQFPSFVLNQRDGMYFQLQPPVFCQSIDVRLYNLEQGPTDMAQVVYEATVVISSAELLAMDTVPVELVAAPGAGIVIVPQGNVSFQYRFVSTPYSGAIQWDFLHGATESFSAVVGDALLLNAAAEQLGFALIGPGIVDDPAIFENMELNLGLSSAVTGGDGDLVVTIQYSLVTLQ